MMSKITEALANLQRVNANFHNLVEPEAQRIDALEAVIVATAEQVNEMLLPGLDYAGQRIDAVEAKVSAAPTEAVPLPPSAEAGAVEFAVVPRGTDATA